MLNGIGFMWLCFGLPVWLMALWGGDDLVVMSLFTHVGGLILSLRGVTRLGIPRFTWLASSLCLITLGFACRYVTPPHANVNISHAIWSGYENNFSSHALYVAFVYSCAVATFLALQQLVKRFFAPAPRS
jgi:hypothetical protein